METKKFTLSDAQFEEIVRINKEGGDPVMYLSSGQCLGRSLQEKINDYWQTISKEMGFDYTTIEPIDNRNFYAKSINH